MFPHFTTYYNCQKAHGRQVIYSHQPGDPCRSDPDTMLPSYFSCQQSADSQLTFTHSA